MENITKPSITRLARKAGVKSLSDCCYSSIRKIIEEDLRELVRVSLVVNSESNTKTLMPCDVYSAMQLLGENVAKSSDLSTKVCAK